VSVLSAGPADGTAPNIDQMVLWPPSNPTHIIACNEQGATDPALQKISLATGEATTIATGIVSCDPVRVTPWGSILFGEENGNNPKSAMWELVNPLSVTGATLNRTTGVSSNTNIARVNALGYLSFEGLAILPSGVIYYGDELGPSNGAAGGAYYKFVPTTKWNGGPAITSIAQSPLKSGTTDPVGTIYGLKVGQGTNNGQGDAYGIGTWVQLTTASGQELRPLAMSNKLTGYFRPEDLTLDEAALAAGNVVFCGNNTGRDSARYWGEAICFTDGTVAQANANSATPQVQLLVQGSPQLNMPDNIAYQPGRGNWIIEEDGSTDTFIDGARNDDIWDCLPDGADDDTLSDGCVRIATLNDLSPTGGAESTGGFFDPTGEHYYVSIQHNNDNTPTNTSFGVVLDITGWGSQG
jgi:secreted PhoX family phosphatase